MKFILHEYISSLKEDNELDAFLKELLLSRNIIPLTKIQKGRQYGVDLPAVGKDEDEIKKLFLFVVKQGNLSRSNWDGNQNAVRESFNEILDFYIESNISHTHRNLPIKIILCCNGEIEQTVNINWTSYINKNTQENISFDFWGINELVQFALKYQMMEDILTSNLSLMLRRALSFIDLPDYNLSHVFDYIEKLLPTDSANEKLTVKNINKKLRLVNLSISIIYSYCEKSNNLKPAYLVAERFVLYTWNWININDYVEHKSVALEYYKILFNWRSINVNYIKKIHKYLKVKDGISLGSGQFNEYCLTALEQAGILSMIGLHELWHCGIMSTIEDPVSEYHFSNAEFVVNTLIDLIENNISGIDPRFDEHCIEINLMLSLFYETGNFVFAKELTNNIINKIILNFRIKDFLPVYYTNIEHLEDKNSKQQKSSILITILAEWCLVLNNLDGYLELINFVKKELADCNLQLWFPDNETEKYLYIKDASMVSGSTMLGIELNDNYLEYKMHMIEEINLFNEDTNCSYYKNSFNFIAMLASRHYRTYPIPNTWRVLMSSNFCFNKN